VTGTSRLRATLFGNTQADNGSPGANMDRLFVNPAEAGTLIETIDHNVDITGICGASTNGFEYILSNGNANSHVTISNSYFRNNPGDMLENSTTEPGPEQRWFSTMLPSSKLRFPVGYLLTLLRQVPRP